MLLYTFYLATLLPSVAVAAISNETQQCKCSPTDSCWPSLATWQTLNASISGNLIKSSPAAIVCYPGPQQDLTACAAVVEELSGEATLADDPIALMYPNSNDYGCPYINYSAGEVATQNCTIGDSPRYVVNATSPQDVAAGVDFARDNNVRLVIRSTGHDFLGRSTGYGSLEIWVRYLRQGITFQQTYVSSNECSNTAWNGSAFSINGGYTWGDVLAAAEEENVIVVSGSDPTVGATGGWAQGGGHSPASRDYGLGVLQILEADVVLANGSIVTANACENQDLYFAIRGGGGGTYGVVTSTTIKAYPNKPVSAQVLTVVPFSDAYIPEFMDALAIIYASYPDLNDAGISGYGEWGVQSPSAIAANISTIYVHRFLAFDKSSNDTETIFAPLISALAQYNTTLAISATYVSFSTYMGFFDALSDDASRVAGNPVALGSRLLDRAALTLSNPNLSTMLNVTAGSPGENAITTLALVAGGVNKIPDPTAALNPVWRTSYLHNIVERKYNESDTATAQAIRDDILNTKTAAMKMLAPNTGCYMNECDVDDTDYLVDFYGESLTRLQQIKAEYDPKDVFYCPTCIGSDKWVSETDGTLCLKA